ALRDKDQKIRTLAAQALVTAGAEVAEELVRAAKEGEAGTRLLALQALGALGEDLPNEGLGALVRGLEDGGAKVRTAAAEGEDRRGAQGQGHVCPRFRRDGARQLRER